jgi:hypothetical protein
MKIECRNPNRYKHGTRARYIIARCRCFPCKVANADYETQRQAERRVGSWRVHYCPKVRHWVVRHRQTGEIDTRSKERPVAFARAAEMNGGDSRTAPRTPVATEEALRHIKRLRGSGVGYKTIADRAHVSRSVVLRMIQGRIRRTRRSTAERILAVTVAAAAPGSHIDAAPTWRLIRKLLARGHRKGALALLLGAKTRALQIGRKRCSAATAQKVRTLFERLTEPVPKRESDVRIRLRARLKSMDLGDFAIGLDELRSA